MASKKALKQLVAGVEKTFKKKDLFYVLGDFDAGSAERIQTIPSLDFALSGGIPRGCTVELFGPESSGKTTVSLCTVAGVQQAGGVAAFVDMEHALDPGWAVTNGVNTDDLLFSQPSYGEEALDLVEYLATPDKSGDRKVDLVVVDSVASLVPKAELEGSMEDVQVGLQARMMSKHLRKVTGIVAKSGTIVLYINQIRKKIGVMYGNPNTTPGGEALKFYASIRIDVKRVGYLGSADNREGIKSMAQVVKSKVCVPFKRAYFPIGRDGVDNDASLLELAIGLGVVNRNGTYFEYRDFRAKGKKAFAEELSTNKKMRKRISRRVDKGLKENPTGVLKEDVLAEMKKAEKEAKKKKRKNKK